MSKRTRLLLLSAGVMAVVIAGALTVNFGADLVREKATEAVRQNLDSQITIGSVTGNPFRGYQLRDISLSADGSEVFTAGSIRAKISFISLLKGPPSLSLLEIWGFTSDVERINRLIAKIKTGGDEGQLPLRKIRLLDSTFSSEWAAAAVRELSLTLDDGRIGADIDIMIDELPVKGKLDVSLEQGISSIRRMDLDVGRGNISAAGAVTPELSLEGSIRDLDINRLAAFWPGMNPDLFSGLLSTTFAAGGTWQKPEISGDLTFSGRMVSGVPVDSASARWKYGDNRIDVTDMDVITFGFPLRGSLAFVLDPSAPPRMRVDLKGTAADLESLSRVSAKLSGMTGTLDEFSIFLEGPVSAPRGRVSFEAARLGFRDYSTSDTRIGADIRDGNVSITGKSVFDGAPVNFSGTIIDFMKNPRASIQGTFRSLSLLSVKKMAPALKDTAVRGIINSDYRISGPLPGMNISGKLWSENMVVGEHSFSGFSTLFDYDQAKDSLAFSEMRTRWKNAAISGNGRITSLSSENRAGDVTLRAANLDPAFVASLYPDASSYRLKGDLTLEAVIRGALSRPSIRASLISPALSIMDSYRFVNLNAGTDITDLKAGVPSDLSLDIRADKVFLQDIALDAVKVDIGKKGQVVTIRQGSANLGSGSLSAQGSLTVEDPFERTGLDVSIKATGIDLEKLAFKGQKALPAAGIVTGDLALTGKVGNPQFTLNASAPFIAASGIKADSARVKLSGNREKVSIEDLSGKVGEGSITVKGDARLAPFAADLSISGQNLDLKPLLARFEKLKPYNITGTANVSFNGNFAEGKNSGSGKITSPSVRFMNMAFTDITLPIELRGDRLISSGGSGKLYGGQIGNNGTINLTDMSFSDEVEVGNTDLAPLLKDAFDMKGSISGRANLSAKISGKLGDSVKYSGNGLLKTGPGTVSGFRALDILASVHGTKGLRFESLFIPFELQTGRITLLKDTLAKAPQGDPLYRHLSALGPVGPENRLDLSCSGNVNMRLLNAFFGAASGGIGALAATPDILGVLKGAIEGAGSAAQDDFRDVSFSIKGNFEKPGFSNLKISAPAKQDPAAQPALPAIQQPVQEKILEQLKPEPAPLPIPVPLPSPSPVPAPVPSPEVKIPQEQAPQKTQQETPPAVEIRTPEPEPEPKPEPEPEPKPVPAPEPVPEVKTTREPEPSKPQQEKAPAAEEITPAPAPAPEPAPTQTVKEDPVSKDIQIEPKEEPAAKEEPPAAPAVKEEPPAKEEPVDREPPAEPKKEPAPPIVSDDVILVPEEKTEGTD